MAEMRGFDRVPPAPVADPWAVADGLRDQAARAGALHRRLSDVEGSAATDDGLVRAAVGAGGLRELVIEPRAMRMASADLAGAVLDVVQRARAEFDRRRAELADELGVQRPDVDLDQSLAQLEQLRAMVAGSHGDLRGAFERFRRQAQG